MRANYKTLICLMVVSILLISNFSTTRVAAVQQHPIGKSDNHDHPAIVNTGASSAFASQQSVIEDAAPQAFG